MKWIAEFGDGQFPVRRPADHGLARGALEIDSAIPYATSEPRRRLRRRSKQTTPPPARTGQIGVTSKCKRQCSYDHNSKAHHHDCEGIKRAQPKHGELRVPLPDTLSRLDTKCFATRPVCQYCIARGAKLSKRAASSGAYRVDKQASPPRAPHQLLLGSSRVQRATSCQAMASTTGPIKSPISPCAIVPPMTPMNITIIGVFKP